MCLKPQPRLRLQPDGSLNCMHEAYKNNSVDKRDSIVLRRDMSVAIKNCYGVARDSEPTRLPTDHPCYGCVHCNTEGTVPRCCFFSCKREEYEKMWRKSL